ncbi:MAG: hypothetical protein IKC79_03540, partial [Clostridia bacterium]|nr:hypothetical protein [Clostridia bacterium]
QIANDFSVYTFRNLAMPTTASIVDNKLIWEHSTDYECNNYTVEIYKTTAGDTAKTLMTRRDAESREFDLSNLGMMYGNYCATIIINAKANNITNNVILLDSSKQHSEDFFKFNTAFVYPTMDNKVKIKVNDTDYAMGSNIEKYNIKLYDGENEEVITLDTAGEIDVYEYIEEWQVNKIKADVTVVAKNNNVDSDTRTIEISVPSITGFALSNQYGTITFDEYLENTTYDYSLQMKDSTMSDYVEIDAKAGIASTTVAVKQTIMDIVTKAGNEDKVFGDFRLSVTANVDSVDLESQKNSTSITLLPMVTNFDFGGFRYGLSKKSANAFGFNFGVQFATAPKVSLETTTGTSIGENVDSTNGTFGISALDIGEYVLVFTNNVAYDVLDEYNILDIPYYHSLSVKGELSPMGSFENFSKGTYYYKLDSFDNQYKIDETSSKPATVDFVPQFGHEYEFDGEKVQLVDGRYTLNLLQADSIKVSVNVAQGLSDTHTYSKTAYTKEANFKYNTVLPPKPNSVDVTNGILNISVALYNEDSYYIVSRNGYICGGERPFTLDEITAKDAFDPSEGTNLSKFQPGDELTIVISQRTNDNVIEAECVVKYTVS